MQYLQNALDLKQLINQANQIKLAINATALTEKNLMFLVLGNDDMETIPMESFTNEFVTNTLNENKETSCFVISDLVSMEAQGKTIHYFLYKGYHKDIEKGLVYYQLIEPDTLKPIGDLQFSNIEENIFFKVTSPDFEESSCNAMETGEQTATEKSIAFLIGHTNEERLIYDIERLIYDTINNVQKNPSVKFNFIIQVSVFGNDKSDQLTNKVSSIDQFCKEQLLNEYPNTKLTFEYE